MNGSLLLKVAFGACLFFHAVAVAQEGAFKNIYWKIYYHESLSDPEEIFYRPSIGDGVKEKILEQDQICVVFTKNKGFFPKLEEISGTPSWPFKTFPYADNLKKNIAILDCGAHITDLWVFQSFHPSGYVDSESPALSLEDTIRRFKPAEFLQENTAAVRAQVAAELLKHWFDIVRGILDRVENQLDLYVTSIEPLKEEKMEQLFGVRTKLSDETLSADVKKDICLDCYYVDPHNLTQKNNFINSLKLKDRKQLVEQISIFENMRLNNDPSSFFGLFVPHSMDIKIANHMFSWINVYVLRAHPEALTNLQEEFLQVKAALEGVLAQLESISRTCVDQYLTEAIFRLQIDLQCHDLWAEK